MLRASQIALEITITVAAKRNGNGLASGSCFRQWRPIHRAVKKQTNNALGQQFGAYVEAR
jgi:hypothetical protein